MLLSSLSTVEAGPITTREMNTVPQKLQRLKQSRLEILHDGKEGDFVLPSVPVSLPGEDVILIYLPCHHIDSIVHTSNPSSMQDVCHMSLV